MYVLYLYIYTLYNYIIYIGKYHIYMDPINLKICIGKYSSIPQVVDFH